jgi:predicted oxidoreductase
MQTVSLGKSSLRCSRLGYGCWRVAGTWNPDDVTPERIETGKKAILAAYDAGYTLFDHADIYCAGHGEKIFGEVLKSHRRMRDHILVATKSGIRLAGEPWSDSPYRYDSSAEHIITACEGSLRRLGVESIDVYQIHRPDYLFNPEEVADAVDRLMRTGKVREFGVSNFNPSQVALMQKHCAMPLITHQMEISLAKLDSFENGTLDQCVSEKITPLAWSPLGGGVLGSPEQMTGLGPRHTVPAHLQETIQSIADARGISRSVIGLAFLLKHPAGILPIVGSTVPERIKDFVSATEIKLTRDEWYRLFTAARDEKLL